MNPEEWMEIAVQYSPIPEGFLLYTIEVFLMHWSLMKGVRGATVGVLYDKFKEHGYKRFGGKLKKRSIIFGVPIAILVNLFLFRQIAELSWHNEIYRR
jgi:hypothetical protein